jgi:hypothetical protein
MPRKRDTEHPDDIGIALASAVTPDQIKELQALGYRGAWPASGPQAAAILQTLRGAPAPRGEPEGQRLPT